MKTRIEQIMQAEQLTPAAFAKVIQVNPSALSHILNGRNQPSLDIVRKIMNMYPDINPDWLISGRDAMRRNETNSAPTLNLFEDMPKEAEKPEKQVVSAPEVSYIVSAPEPVKSLVETPTPTSIPMPMTPVVASEKKIERITVYYSDKVYEDFLPKNV